MENAHIQEAKAPSATKVLLFRHQGAELLREAMAAGVLTTEVNRQIESVVSENDRLIREIESLRELTISQRTSIISMRSRSLEQYRTRTPERMVPQSWYYAAVLSAISFFATTLVLTVAQILNSI